MQVTIRSLLTACLVSSALLGMGNEASAAAKSVQEQKAEEACVVDPRGEILSLSCASCHGTDGKSVGIIPSFYGKSPEYLEAALKDFRSGTRYSTVMIRHAKGYSDEEIRLIAQYFGTVWQNNK
ncbi:MAG: sulfide dehydrogenase [Chlorobium sp.]|jgi:sulfide dehydrogenase cytochrome subunit|uniref:c-type cytochrome n=1 Tax=Chlorobium sp. TaxID=1095 RepID=UPI001DA785AA|nr:c-type cytochrome [Chlorobium sp.]MBN1278332.1 sulfide dehydrogenase [Chlorobiaceae bacterium]MCF8216337.1 sulfide dehydrogenase [Chlorobium sp.]MCF8271239.1 sulfide dehydrogenase [Chlorobium sp.]MCF8287613.1 sulfide dehydrogenase [Chlorobium sp.]MCF8291152.1 sulfide dehydrogenase [Chlorobium sp.]